VSENVLETIRATVQDFLAPEIKTHGIRLDNIDRRLDEMRIGIDRRFDETRSSLEHRIDDSKETLRAEMRALDARFDALDARFDAIDARFNSLENLVRSFMQQVSVETSLREREASLEARLPKQ
jgi:hypothetical protein